VALMSQANTHLVDWKIPDPRTSHTASIFSKQWPTLTVPEKGWWMLPIKVFALGLLQVCTLWKNTYIYSTLYFKCLTAIEAINPSNSQEIFEGRVWSAAFPHIKVNLETHKLKHFSNGINIHIRWEYQGKIVESLKNIHLYVRI
jgi:hypothetical protein